MNKLSNKKWLVIRFIAFIVIGFIAPIIYVSVKFDLFKNGKNSITIWGIIVLLILFLTIIYFIKYFALMLKTRPYIRGVLSGFCKVIIPILLILIFAFLVKGKLDTIKQHLDTFIETIIVILCCELLAVIVNPLPQIAFNDNVDGIGDILLNWKNKLNNKEEVGKEE